LDLSDHEEYFHLPPPLARQGGSAGKFFIDWYFSWMIKFTNQAFCI
jgi:hypothetical protein